MSLRDNITGKLQVKQLNTHEVKENNGQRYPVVSSGKIIVKV